MEQISASVNWTVSLEKYFKVTGEKAHALSVLHKASEAKFAAYRTWLDLPCIVGSSIIGFFSVGSSQFLGTSPYASVATGIGSLLVGVLNTVNSYFAYSKRTEGHRIAAIQYSKLYRFLVVELSLPREQRIAAADLLKIVKEQYDRLQEVAPAFPPDIILHYKQEYKKVQDIAVPEELNGFERIEIFNPLHSRPSQQGFGSKETVVPNSVSVSVGGSGKASE